MGFSCLLNSGNIVQASNQILSEGCPNNWRGHYVGANGHYGTTIGRFANRIRGAEIVLDGKAYKLDPDKNGDLDQGGRMAYFRLCHVSLHSKVGREP